MPREGKEIAATEDTTDDVLSSLGDESEYQGSELTNNRLDQFISWSNVVTTTGIKEVKPQYAESPSTLRSERPSSTTPPAITSKYVRDDSSFDVQGFLLSSSFRLAVQSATLQAIAPYMKEAERRIEEKLSNLDEVWVSRSKILDQRLDEMAKYPGVDDLKRFDQQARQYTSEMTALRDELVETISKVRSLSDSFPEMSIVVPALIPEPPSYPAPSAASSSAITTPIAPTNPYELMLLELESASTTIARKKELRRQLGI
jgi:hypothetical protein